MCTILPGRFLVLSNCTQTHCNGITTFCNSGEINYTVMQFSTLPLSFRKFVRSDKLKSMRTLFLPRGLMIDAVVLLQFSPQEVTKGAATHGQHHIPDISVVLRFFVEFLLTISYSLMRVMFSMEECRFLSLLSPRIGR